MTSPLHPIAVWLLALQGPLHLPEANGEPSPRPGHVLTGEELLGSIAERLLAEGVPLMRGSMSVPTLHPEVSVQNLLWRRGQPVEVVLRYRDLTAQPFYLDSPIAAIHRGAGAIRCRLEGPDADLRYPIVRDLRAAGATDYIALPLPFSDGRRTFLSWATDAPGGFTGEHLALLESLAPFVALRLEIASTHHAMRSLLDVYLGKNAAERVLAGGFLRGGGERIFAAIWYCDLRGFTELMDSSSPDDVVRALDRYFDGVGSPIHALGGEVLKFIGDAVLAIFPVAGEPLADVCRRAEEAALRAIAAMETVSAERLAQGLAPLRIGVALHVGEVLYGNIGAEGRLDFTVIGAAVNEAVRMESLCKPLGVDLVLADRFAEARGLDGLISLGEHTLRGVREPHEMFTLAALPRDGRSEP